jgi:hypothetical protein
MIFKGLLLESSMVLPGFNEETNISSPSEMNLCVLPVMISWPLSKVNL